MAFLRLQRGLGAQQGGVLAPSGAAEEESEHPLAMLIGPMAC